MKKPLEIVNRLGIIGLLTLLKDQVFPTEAKCLALAREIVAGKNGIEIGGPSPSFRDGGILPLYSHIEKLDNCNFSAKTKWEGEIRDGQTFEYHPSKAIGTQYISEASDLRGVQPETYNFLLSSHVIEHLANPIQGLQEWLRTLKADGHLILLVPHFIKTFDHQRPVTPLGYLVNDFEQHTGEDDLTHLEEILEFHDLNRDPGAGSFEEFASRSRLNFQNRCLHQHVFDNQLVIDIMSLMNLRILSCENVRPNHILVVARKADPIENNVFSLENKKRKSWDKRL